MLELLGPDVFKARKEVCEVIEDRLFSLTSSPCFSIVSLNALMYNIYKF